MIKIENTDVYGFDSAIRGMRNPMNSWSKSDSYPCYKALTEEDFYDAQDCGEINKNAEYIDFEEPCRMPDGTDLYCGYIIGVNDLKLMRSLARAGSDHGKFARMINVTCDITAPLYWWKEYDTYKVGTVANSCSTMHKIHSKEFTLDDFSYEHLINISDFEFKEEIFFDDSYHLRSRMVAINGLELIIKMMNHYRRLYIETKDKRYWWQMIQLLPSSYNQKRTVQLNYQVLWSMYKARKDHKLDEWHEFCRFIESLPYFKEIFLSEE